MMNSNDFLENKIKNNETITLDEKGLGELLTYIVMDVQSFNKRLKLCEHMLYLDDESFKNLKGDDDDDE